MEVEVLFRVNDGGHIKDGEVVSIKGPGWRISAEDMIQWLDKGVEPVVLGEMPKYHADLLKHRINKQRFYLSHTTQEIVDEFKGISPMNLQEADEAKVTAQRKYTERTTEGWETMWGRDDCMKHFVVRMDLEYHDIVDMLSEDMDTDHIGKSNRKRRNRIAYEEVFDARVLADIRDPEKRLLVDRSTVVSKNKIRPTVAQEVK